jgi:hypothetical protein
MTVSIIAPFPVIPDATGGPLSVGFLYVGQPNLNPITLANRIPIFADPGLSIPLAQPVSVSGGFARNASGAPTNVYAATSFAMTITDRNNVVQMNAPSYGFRVLSDAITFGALVVGTSVLPDAAGGAVNGSLALPWSSSVTQGLQAKTATVYNQAQPVEDADLAALNQRKSVVMVGRQVSVGASASFSNHYNVNTATSSRTGAGVYLINATVTLPVSYVVLLTLTLETGFDARLVVSARGAGGFTVKTHNNGVATDLPFDFVVFGNPAVADPIS